MDPFEERVKELPWRKPSNELRERLFSQDEDTVVRIQFLSRIPLGWAALFLVCAGALTYALWSAQETPTIADAPAVEAGKPVVSEGLKPLEIASNQNFFDFSSRRDDAWSGPLTLTIEPN